MTRDVPAGFPRLDKATRPWSCPRDNQTCTRKDPCPSCRGSRNRRSGLRKQRDVRKVAERQLGAQAGKYATQTANEENWRLPVRVEVKSGAQVGPIATRYVKWREQADAALSVGDPRPFAVAAVPVGWPAGKFLWVVASDEVEDFAMAFVEAAVQ